MMTQNCRLNQHLISFNNLLRKSPTCAVILARNLELNLLSYKLVNSGVDEYQYLATILMFITS